MVGLVQLPTVTIPSDEAVASFCKSCEHLQQDGSCGVLKNNAPKKRTAEMVDITLMLLAQAGFGMETPQYQNVETNMAFEQAGATNRQRYVGIGSCGYATVNGKLGTMYADGEFEPRE